MMLSDLVGIDNNIWAITSDLQASLNVNKFFFGKLISNVDVW